jgi:uncharacterized membrane protein YphA (DoxX/SURF4 family)
MLAVIPGAAYLTDGGPHPLSTSLIAVVAIASGLSLLAGFLTPIAGSLTMLGGLGVLLSWLSLPSVGQVEIKLITTMVIVVAVAVVLLGPGALSLDAKLFGRHEIIIPRAPQDPEL